MVNVIYGSCWRVRWSLRLTIFNLVYWLLRPLFLSCLWFVLEHFSESFPESRSSQFIFYWLVYFQDLGKVAHRIRSFFVTLPSKWWNEFYKHERTCFLSVIFKGSLFLWKGINNKKSSGIMWYRQLWRCMLSKKDIWWFYFGHCLWAKCHFSFFLLFLLHWIFTNFETMMLHLIRKLRSVIIMGLILHTPSRQTFGIYIHMN